MDRCVRLIVKKQSSAFRLQLNERMPQVSPLSVIFVVDDSLDFINSDLVEVLQDNRVPQGLKTVKETASLRIDTNLPQVPFCVEELRHSRQRPRTASLVCAVCRLETQDFQQLNIHYREHLVDGPLQCSHCEGPTYFQKLATFKEHLRSHLESTADNVEVTARDGECIGEPNKFAAECEMCHKKFPTVKGLGAHRRTHKIRTDEGDLQGGQSASVKDRDQQPHPTDRKPHEVRMVLQQSERPATIRELLASAASDQPGSNHTTKIGSLLTCSICNAAFSLQTKLNSHILHVHHEQLERCPQCDKVHLSTGQLRNHILERHTAHFSFVAEAGSDPSGHPQMACNHCSGVYQDPVELLLHCKMIHADRMRSLDCPHCGKTFATEKRFANHVSSKGSECARRPSCSVCFRCFSSQKALADHMRSIHPQNGQINRLWYCTECNEGYATKAALRYHIKAKHGSERFPCAYCDKTFALAVQKHRHETRVHQGNPKQYACNLCSMAFFTTRELLQHLLNGHKVVPDVNEHGEAILPDGTIGPTMKYYACQDCSYTTYSRKAFIRHQANHTGVWPFTCEVCGKGFSERFQALKHVRVQHSLTSNENRSDVETSPKEDERSPQRKSLWEQSTCEGTVVGIQAKDMTHAPSTSYRKMNSDENCGNQNERSPPVYSDIQNDETPSKATRMKQFNAYKVCNLDSLLEATNASTGRRNRLRDCLRRAIRVSGCWSHSCRRCSRRFRDLKEQIVHRYHQCRTMQRSKVFHSCPYCHVRIVSAAVFGTHLRMHQHSEVKAFTCTSCAASYSFESSLTAHIRQSHPEIGHWLFPCTRCSRGFLTEWSLERHKKIHGQYCGHQTHAFETSDELLHQSVDRSAVESGDNLFGAVEGIVGAAANVEEVMISSAELLEIGHVDQESVKDIANVVDVVPSID